MNDWIYIAPAIVAAIFSIALCWLWPRLGLFFGPVLAAAAGLSIGAIDIRDTAAELGWALGILCQFLNMLAILAAPHNEKSAWPKAAVKWTFIFLGVLLGLDVTGRLLGPMGFLLALVLFATIVRYLLISRDARTVHLFTTLGAAIRQSLPLTTALDAEGGAMMGKVQRIFIRVSKWLAEGLPLSEAIRRGYPECPGYALGQIEAAEKTHQLPAAVANIERQLLRKEQDARKFQVVNPVYPCLVFLTLCFVVGRIGIFVLPNFEFIFQDMGASLPALTRWVFSNATPVGTVLLALCALAPIWLYLLFRPRNPRRPKALSRLGDFVKWHLPAARWFEKNYALLSTVSFLRQALLSGNRVDDAIEGAAGLDVNLRYRRKLEEWLRRVRSGEEISGAAGDSGVGKSLQWAFDQAANPGQTPSVLEMLESSYRAAYSFKANMVRYALWPGLLVLWASAVGCVVLALFLPIASLVQHVVGEVVP
jgi:type II secretory pathway component PulF